MRIPVKLITDADAGFGVLTNEHSASSYGQPVFVDQFDGKAYGPLDIHDRLGRAMHEIDMGSSRNEDGGFAAPAEQARRQKIIKTAGYRAVDTNGQLV